ncbi:MAG: hypothetical protein ACRBFS_15440 [Aureispira sp.]
MNRDILRLYKRVKEMEDSPEIEQIKEMIDSLLDHDLQQNILEITNIGKAVGYDRVRAHFRKALDMIDLAEDKGK